MGICSLSSSAIAQPVALRWTSTPSSGPAGTVITGTSEGGDPCPLANPAVAARVKVTLANVDEGGVAAEVVGDVDGQGQWSVRLTVPGPPKVYETHLELLTSCFILSDGSDSNR